MWSDNEATLDQLGFKTHADLVYQLVMDDTLLPVTIGVFGDWGSGKSSIMRMVEQDLKPHQEDTLCLYFNGWIFEGYDDAKAALLQSVLEAFKQRTNLAPKAIQKIKKLFASIHWMRITGLAFKNIVLPAASAYFGGPDMGMLSWLAQHQTDIAKNPKVALKQVVDQLKDADDDKLASLLKDSEEEKAMLVREFRQDFQELIEQTDIKRLIVLIDDLDRCSPERLIENLEAIKLFLNVPRTAFVVSADPRIVQHALEFRYKSRLTADEPMEADDKTERLSKRFVKDYLEKLIQIPYNLPKLSDQEVETYLTLLFCQKHLSKDAYGRVMNQFTEFRSQHRYQVFGLTEILPILNAAEQAALNQDARLIVALAPLITRGLKGNPRQIKRFLNSFTLRSKLANVARMSSFRVEILAKLMILEYSELGLFRALYEWQVTQQGEPKELAELERLAQANDLDAIRQGYKPAEWSSGGVVEWLNMEPKLADVDLRDYFWLSRDQLLGSISGSSLIPQHVKALFSELIQHGSDSLLNQTIDKKYNQLSETEGTELLKLLEKELIKRPGGEKVHKVFFALIAKNIPHALLGYKAVIARIDHNEIPFVLHTNIKIIARINPAIMELKNVFKADSRIGKALGKQ